MGFATSRSSALVVLLGAGFLLRVWGLDYGLPMSSARPDEEVLIQKILGFDAGDPNPHWFIYPTLSLYVLYAWVKTAFVAGHAVGLWGGPTDLATLVRTEPASLYLVARALAAAFGTATIWAAYALGRTAANAGAGLIAALLTAVCFLHVRESHFFKPDVTLSFFTTLALLGCVRLQQRGTWGAAIAAGVVCGLAVAVKYGVVLLAPLLLAALLAPPPGRGVPGRPARAAVALAATGVAFAVTSPYALIAYDELFRALRVVRMWVGQAGDGVASGFRYHALYSFLAAQGLPLSAAVLGALAWAARERSLAPIAAFAAASLLQLGLSAAALSRYVTPILPALYVLVGAASMRLLVRMPPRTAPIAGGLLLGILVARPLHSAVRFDQIIAEPDTRLLAESWMDAHVPRGSSVLLLGAPWPYTFGDPPLGRYKIRRNLPLDPALGVRWVVTHEHPIPFSHVPAGFGALRPSLRLEQTISPFAGEAAPGDSLFELSDGFYVPISGFAEVVRGGPIIHIYSVTAPENGHAPS